MGALIRIGENVDFIDLPHNLIIDNKGVPFIQSIPEIKPGRRELLDLRQYKDQGRLLDCFGQMFKGERFNQVFVQRGIYYPNNSQAPSPKNARALHPKNARALPPKNARVLPPKNAQILFLFNPLELYFDFGMFDDSINYAPNSLQALLPAAGTCMNCTLFRNKLCSPYIQQEIQNNIMMLYPACSY